MFASRSTWHRFYQMFHFGFVNVCQTFVILSENNWFVLFLKHLQSVTDRNAFDISSIVVVNRQYTVDGILSKYRQHATQLFWRHEHFVQHWQRKGLKKIRHIVKSDPIIFLRFRKQSIVAFRVTRYFLSNTFLRRKRENNFDVGRKCPFVWMHRYCCPRHVSNIGNEWIIHASDMDDRLTASMLFLSNTSETLKTSERLPRRTWILTCQIIFDMIVVLIVTTIRTTRCNDYNWLERDAFVSNVDKDVCKFNFQFVWTLKLFPTTLLSRTRAKIRARAFGCFRCVKF